ncbi:FMN-binding domain-containing protein [Bifidobacterium tissieri]|uniref:FMN-binding domain-containing protein n=1 Tax=Bifidobacterium tissieri TaxID=1630162 RepID=A0A261FFJ0_9BIFI|nr:FMN-binding protein [Bifidobacterium tissieri]OZG57646.1 FMN-binding domain-containing protein [Bifidobacterium tissieri]
MNATITRAAVAVIAGLAIVGDAFLLFVKPHADVGAASTSQSGTLGASSGADSTDSTDSGTTGNSTDDSSNSSDSSDSASGSAGTLTDGTYTSVASPNEYGEVQLQVVVKDGKITSVNAITYPNHTDRSRSISAQAIPELAERAISKQSSDIQFVSGATETSTAFVNSLQDAINQALNASK